MYSGRVTSFCSTSSIRRVPLVKNQTPNTKNDRQYNGQKGNQTPNTKKTRKYNGQKGNQTPNTKNDTQYNGQNGHPYTEYEEW
jgi:hypothetical protein